MEKSNNIVKHYPEIDYEYYFLDALLRSNIRIKFRSIVTTLSGDKVEVFDSYDFYTKTNTENIPKIIECTNRFHQMCQKYINEWKLETT